MTHDKLLAKITTLENGLVIQHRFLEMADAIRAVVELHKPWNFGCSHCINIEGGYMSYPCPTIQAIEKELV